MRLLDALLVLVVGVTLGFSVVHLVQGDPGPTLIMVGSFLICVSVHRIVGGWLRR